MTTRADVCAAPTTDLPAAMQRTMADPMLVGRELLALIADSIRNHPRSQQVAIGPSEYGHECARRIGYKLLGTPEREKRPNWKAQVGTYGHAGLEDVLDMDNLVFAEHTGEGEERWLVETRVSVGDVNGRELTGSSDAFDRLTGTVIDWKFVGPTMLKNYRRKKSPGDGYRRQIHGYGRGFTRRGLTVRHVMIVFLPRDGELEDAYIWTEPYDEQIAINALERATGISLSVETLGVDALPLIPTTNAFCTHCPFFLAGSTDPRVGCPGDAKARPNAPAKSALTITD